MELHELLDAVQDQRSFLEFVKALIADREDEVAKERLSPSSPYGPGANGWENGTIEDFLEAATGWAEDSELRSEPRLVGQSLAAVRGLSLLREDL